MLPGSADILASLLDSYCLLSKIRGCAVELPFVEFFARAELIEMYYLTTAIDYANAPPHIGHAYEKIAADIIARYQRLCKQEVFFLTGTDEHGIKVEKAATAANMPVQAFVDSNAAKFQDAWKRLEISNDYFVRTTSPQHKKAVQEIFSNMREKQDIYKNKYKGLYCEGCEDFLRERDLVDGNCAYHQKPPKLFEEENYFFRLNKYKEAVRKWLTSEPYPVKPEGRRLEVLNQLEDPELGDFSITRSRSSLSWGIPVPNEPEQVIYVWIDALSNYISAIGYPQGSWQKFWPANVHIIGKDINKFHSIYWPAILLSLGLPLPKLVFSHGFITVEGQKMSKSLGNVLDPIYLTETYGAEAIRYFLFCANTFELDGDFSCADMIKIVNSHLANGLGNLLNRILTLLVKNCEGKVPEALIEKKMIDLCEEKSVKYHGYMQDFEFSKALRAIFDIVDESNKLVNDTKPWEMFASSRNDQGASVLHTALIALKRVAILLSPFTPKLANDIWYQLGFDSDIIKVTIDSEEYKLALQPGQLVRNKGPAFARLDEKLLSANACA